jgi:dephospho-CoA kinase
LLQLAIQHVSAPRLREIRHFVIGLPIVYQPVIIGLTGNIATGKSTVLAYLRRKGAHVIDADKLTHRAMAPGGPAHRAIIDTFGPGIVRDDGAIDRAALGRIVFSDPQALQQLETLIHPAVFVLAQAEIGATTAPVIIVEAIKLLEARRLLTLCQAVWVVVADPEVQLRRLIHERKLSEADALQRMNAQGAQTDKVAQATRVITNNGTRRELEAQLDVLWNELLAAT